MNDQQVWAGVLAHLRKHSPAICRQWFHEIEPLGVVNGTLQLRAHSVVHRDYLQRECVNPFADAARTVTGRLISVRFIGPDDEMVIHSPARRTAPGEPAAPALPPLEAAPADAVPASPPPQVSVELAPPPPSAAALAAEVHGAAPVAGISAAGLDSRYDDGLILNPDYGFDNFVVGPGNRLAHAAALAVASNPGRAYNPFFVHGGVGLGKTHLLQAICLSIRQSRPEAVIYYTSCEGFMTQFFDAVQAGVMTRFRHKFRHVDVLVIDDIHFLASRDRSQEEFFHTFNSLYQCHKQIVLSSDAPPEEIPDLEDRLVSRFKWGLVAALDAPCFETRVAIIKSKAKIRGLVMPDDVACYIADKIDTNIRELEGAIIKLQVLASVDQRPIDLALAHQALGDAEVRVEPRVQIHSIIDAVTEFYGVRMTDMQSRKRQRSVAQPRQLCMWLARKHTRLSLEEIGGHFGGRDHTTVMHAVRTINDRCDTDGEFLKVVKSIEEQLRDPGAAQGAAQAR